MSYLDKYKAKLAITGASIADSVKNNTINSITANFSDSPFYREVLIDGVQFGVRIEDVTSIVRSNNIKTLQDTNKYMLMQPNQNVQLGAIVEFDNRTYLVTDVNDEQNIYPKAKLEKCNTNISVVTGTQTIDTGNVDALGRPIFKTVNTTVDMPAILTGKLAGASFGNEINLPQGSILLTVKYDSDSQKIKQNDVYTVYDSDYKVVSFDYTNIDFTYGILTMRADQVVN